MARASSFTVIYWMGGTVAGEWRRAAAVATEQEAHEMAASIQRGGRVALINRTEVWDAIGLPEGPPVRFLRAMGG